MTRPKLLYLAGPYRSKDGVWGVRQNIARATEVARELWMMGYAVFCPHANTAFMDGGDAWSGGATAHGFLEGDLEFLRRSDLMVLLPGWEASRGVAAELTEAQLIRLPVYIWPRDKDLLAAGEVACRRPPSLD